MQMYICVYLYEFIKGNQNTCNSRFAIIQIYKIHLQDMFYKYDKCVSCERLS